MGAHAVTAGYQSVSSGSSFTQLNQGNLPDKGAGGVSLYLYTDRLIQTFTRAGERTAFGQYAYDFVALGVPGLKASVMYLSGDNIKTTSAIARRNGSAISAWTTYCSPARLKVSRSDDATASRTARRLAIRIRIG